MHASTWSPLWWLDDGSAFITTMHRDTTKVWTSAMAVARSRAEGAMTAWSEMELQFGSYVPAAAAKAASGWAAQLEAAADSRGARRARDELDGCGGRGEQGCDPR